MKKIVMPQCIPGLPRSWRLRLIAQWHDENMTVSAEVSRFVDSNGNRTPICYQFDWRKPPEFVTGYTIDGVARVFRSWGELWLFWPEYLKSINQQE